VAAGESGRRAAKSFVKTNVESYAGCRSPFALVLRAQVAARSYAATLRTGGFSSRPSHGRRYARPHTSSTRHRAGCSAVRLRRSVTPESPIMRGPAETRRESHPRPRRRGSSASGRRHIHEDQPSNGGRQLLLGRGISRCRDDRVRVLETCHGADADDAPLGVVRHHDQTASRRDKGAVGLGLHDVRRREARPRIDPMRAHEDHVHVQRADHVHGERPTSASEECGRAAEMTV